MSSFFFNGCNRIIGQLKFLFIFIFLSFQSSILFALDCSKKENNGIAHSVLEKGPAVTDQDGLGTCYANSMSSALSMALGPDENGGYAQINFLDIAMNYSLDPTNLSRERKIFKRKDSFVDDGYPCFAFNQLKKVGGYCTDDQWTWTPEISEVESDKYLEFMKALGRFISQIYNKNHRKEDTRSYLQALAKATQKIMTTPQNSCSNDAQLTQIQYLLSKYTELLNFNEEMSKLSLTSQEEKLKFHQLEYQKTLDNFNSRSEQNEKTSKLPEGINQFDLIDPNSPEVAIQLAEKKVSLGIAESRFQSIKERWESDFKKKEELENKREDLDQWIATDYPAILRDQNCKLFQNNFGYQSKCTDLLFESLRKKGLPDDFLLMNSFYHLRQRLVKDQHRLMGQCQVDLSAQILLDTSQLNDELFRLCPHLAFDYIKSTEDFKKLLTPLLGVDPELFKILGELIENTANDLVNNDPYQFVMNTLGRNCKDNRHPIPKNLVCEQTSLPTKNDFAITLSDMISQSKGVEITVCTKFFDDPKAFTIKGLACIGNGAGHHSMLAVGERCLNGKKQIQIKNSWGLTCPLNFLWDPQYIGSNQNLGDCERNKFGYTGTFWIDEEILIANTSSYSVLVKNNKLEKNRFNPKSP